MAKALYVQYGAGKSCPDGWINFDVSPTLRIQQIPLLGPLIVPKDQQFPEKTRFGDIVTGLPVPPSSADGIYASHVLEHLSLADFRIALRNTFRLLRPSGVFRCIVPDLGERARRYASALDAGDPDGSFLFMRGSHLGHETRPRGLEGSLRAIFGNSEHLWMWDEASIKRELHEAGFTSIRRCDFGDATDPMFAAVESAHRFIDEDFTPPIREVAMEAFRPAA